MLKPWGLGFLLTILLLLGSGYANAQGGLVPRFLSPIDRPVDPFGNPALVAASERAIQFSLLRDMRQDTQVLAFRYSEPDNGFAAGTVAFVQEWTPLWVRQRFSYGLANTIRPELAIGANVRYENTIALGNDELGTLISDLGMVYQGETSTSGLDSFRLAVVVGNFLFYDLNQTGLPMPVTLSVALSLDRAGLGSLYLGLHDWLNTDGGGQEMQLIADVMIRPELIVDLGLHVGLKSGQTRWSGGFHWQVASYAVGYRLCDQVLGSSAVHQLVVSLAF